MYEAIRHNLSNLTILSGRDSRSTFWFYVLFLVIIQVAISFGLSILAGGAMVADAVHSARNGAGEVAMQQQMLARMGSFMRISMWGSALFSLATTLLLAASFTRRLHDSDKPGWIAAIVVTIQFIAIAWTIATIDEMAQFIASVKLDSQETMQAAIQAQQSKFALRGILGWLPTLCVVVFGVWPSSDGDNRYGSEPDHI